jgi:hypothetical protein
MTLVRTPTADATRRRILNNEPLLLMLDPAHREELIQLYMKSLQKVQEERSNG